MTDSWYVACHFDAVGQSHPGYLAECGIRFFRSRSVDPHADPSTLRASLQGGCVFLVDFVLTPVADQLIESRHIQVENDSRVLRISGKMLNPKFSKKFFNYKIIYGGSVNSKNSKFISKIDIVNGLLIGGASLKINEFNQIIS